MAYCLFVIAKTKVSAESVGGGIRGIAWAALRKAANQGGVKLHLLNIRESC